MQGNRLFTMSDEPQAPPKKRRENAVKFVLRKCFGIQPEQHWIGPHIPWLSNLLALLLAALLAAVPLTLLFWPPDCEYRHTGQRLSELSQEECLQFIQRKGVVLPTHFRTGNPGAFVRYVIRCAEDQSARQQIRFSNPAAANLAEAVRKIVNTYYGTDGGAYLYILRDGDNGRDYIVYH